MTAHVDEVPAALWETTRLELPGRPKARYECAGSCWGVFRCRAPGMRFACGRYVCACVGGSDDNRCSECWCRLDKATPRLLRGLLRSGSWRFERRLSMLIAGEEAHPVVLGALWAMFECKKLDVRGIPFRYRIAWAA